MIEWGIGSLVGSTVEVHVLWLIFGLYLAYEMGYYRAERKFKICGECCGVDQGRCLMAYK